MSSNPRSCDVYQSKTRKYILYDTSKVIQWLLSGDESIAYLVRKHLLEEQVKQTNGGIIQKYLDLYNKETRRWGDGFYSPKWISSTYTLLDLVYFEATVTDEMIEGYDALVDALWCEYHLNPKKRTLDLCIVGMLIKIGSFIHSERLELADMIDFVLHTLNHDGAWNCYYDYREYKTSSVHTTINILEGLHLYTNQFSYRKEELINAIHLAQEFLLLKNLHRSRRTGEIIHKDFMSFHFPTRWKYDATRAMEYMTDVNTVYDERMSETVEYILENTKRGPLPKGKRYSGKIHFTLEEGRQSRINTYRALKILKKYKNDEFLEIIKQEDYV